MTGPQIPEPRQALTAMLSHAARHSPYYRDQAWARRLLEYGTLNFSEIPITAKRIVKATPELFFSGFVPAEDGQVLDKHTSGSTGEPTPVRKTARHFEINLAEYQRLRSGWGFANHKRIVRIISNELHLRLGDLKEEPLPGGGRQWTFVSGDPEVILDLLLRTSATLVISVPSVIRGVIERSLETSRPLALQLITTVSELVPDELRELIRQIPGCLLMDSYGCVEAGLIAVQCPLCDAYHSADRHLIFELLGEDGRPTKPGEMGRVVVTPLFNSAMPLVRYETGDYAIERAGPDCPRGRRAIERILGRERNLSTLADGRKIWPALPAAELLELGARRFKLVQTKIGEVELRYIPREEHGEIARQTAQALVDKYMSPGFTVHSVRVADLPRSASGKYLMHESMI